MKSDDRFKNESDANLAHFKYFSSFDDVSAVQYNRKEKLINSRSNKVRILNVYFFIFIPD